MLPGYDILLQTLLDRKQTLMAQAQDLDDAIQFLQTNPGPCKRVLDALAKIPD